MKNILFIALVIMILLMKTTKLSAADPSQAPANEGVTVEATTQPKENSAEREARMAWWREAKFGLFIHWGVYAVPAGKYGDRTDHGEWILLRGQIPLATYRDFAARFNPVKYDPAQWAKIAKDAGMRYVVITAKHHDGFALYPSDVTTWDIADATPYKKDLLGPLTEAVRAEGLRMGFYYSQAQDWMHPGGAKQNVPDGGDGWDEAQKGRFDDYLDQIAIPQVRELLTRYPIDILWWDTPISMTAPRVDRVAPLTKLHPEVLTNDRLGNGSPGDFITPEQYVPITGHPGDWETCMTINSHWGYNAYDKNWKSTSELIRKLADICSKGGNLLLNVGPTAEGEFPPECVERLQEIGRWLRANGDSIYGTTAGPFHYLPWGVATRKGQTLYLHVFDWPQDGTLRVPLDNPIESATLLATGQTLEAKLINGRVEIAVPATAPDPIDTVIALRFSGEPSTDPLLTLGARVTASAFIPGGEPENLIDGTGAKRWRAPQDATSGWVELELKEPATVGAFGFDEPDVWPRMKQSFVLEAWDNGEWKKLAEGKTIGHGAKQKIEPVTAQRFRLTMSCDKGSPGVAELQLYRAEFKPTPNS